MSFIPLYDRVAIKPVEQETKSTGGIIIPDIAQEKSGIGEVVSVGEGKLTDDGKIIPSKLKKGDKVVYGKWAGTEVKVDGENLIIMKESDVLGLLK